MPLIQRTAAQSTFRYFYHYQPFEKGYVIDMLRDQMLFCSSPDNVNDPWDCKPWFDYRPMLADPKTCEAMIEFYRRTMTKEIFDDPLRIEYEERLRTEPDFLRSCVAESSLRIGKELAKRRIYCLTPLPDNTLMWSHYSDNHKGICLEFANNNALIGNSRPITYKTEYPEWTPQAMMDGNITELVLTKAMDWSYESEFRIIASHLEGPTKLCNGYFVKLPPRALTAIIIGCENRVPLEIIEIIKEYSPDITIKWAHRALNAYKIVIADQPRR